jgi:pyruvate kinase
LRRLQIDLLPYLSSFGRSEARVLTSIDALIASLRAIAGEASVYPHARAFFRGERFLRENTRDIFGAPAGSRRTRIMVRFASEMARDPALVEALIAAGMNCARINCAHDDVSAWRAMVANVRRAE